MARKQDKLRPYRVDYFNIDEMKDNDMCLVRSEIVRAVTSAEAASHVVDYNEALPLVLIRSYRFYKQLPKQSTVYKAVEDLFSEKNALIVMGEVEKYRAEQAQTNDLGNTPAAQAQMDALAEQHDAMANEGGSVVPDHATPDPAYGVERATFYKTNAGTQVQPHPMTVPEYFGGKMGQTPTSGPTSPATVAVVDDLAGMLAHDAHEQVMDKFVPDSVPAGRTFTSNADMHTEVTPFGEKCPECEDGINSPMPGTPDLRDLGVAPTWQKILLFAGMLGVTMLLIWLILPHK